MQKQRIILLQEHEARANLWELVVRCFTKSDKSYITVLKKNHETHTIMLWADNKIFLFSEDSVWSLVSKYKWGIDGMKPWHETWYVTATTEESSSMWSLLMNMHWHWTQDRDTSFPILLPSSPWCLQQFIKLWKQWVEKRQTFWFPCSGTKPTDICVLF